MYNSHIVDRLTLSSIMSKLKVYNHCYHVRSDLLDCIDTFNSEGSSHSISFVKPHIFGFNS